MSLRRTVPLMAALALVVVANGLSLPLLHAQSVTATVKGRVVDTDGSGLPGVVVIIKSKSQPSGNKQVVTDIEGNYKIPLLPPAGDYIIRVDYPGFAPMEMGPLDLDPGKITVADLTLRSDAETTETIVVESKGNIVDTSSTKTSSNYSGEFIEGLPIIGSNYQDILTLAPGVTDTDGDGNPNVHGARDTGLQYRLDGGNITDVADGGFGQNLNPDLIEEIEVITSGASAEYGRADGGFANVISKSGGNDFQGKFTVRWRGRFLNGDGANNNDVNTVNLGFPNYNDVRPTLSLGGAVVKDKVWYFASLDVIDAETPVAQPGNPRIRSFRGHRGFGKVTWQVNSYNKLALQVNSDPIVFRGNNIALGVAPESDYKASQGGVVPQLKWTSTISPQLLLESTITHFRSGIATTSVSPFFEPTEVTRVRETSSETIQARYPCEVINCNPERGERKIYQRDLINGTINGPWPQAFDDKRIRNGIKTDLSYSLEDFLGQHSFKAGIEFQDEKFSDKPILNPFIIDVTRPFNPGPGQTGGGGGANQDQITGVQVLSTFQPLETPQRAVSFNSGAYLQDAWKPRPNLTVNVGVRVDREDIDTSGFQFFDPQAERKRAVSLWGAMCTEAIAQGFSDGRSNCLQSAGYDGNPPSFFSDAPNGLRSFRDDNNDGINDVDPRIIALDINDDGFVGNTGEEYDAWFSDFTLFLERETRNFQIVNNNLSPRFSISWDPWADGKTKMFGSWGRYYDRLFLNTIRNEIGPDRVNYAFIPDPTTHIIAPGAISLAASTVSITQVDRNLSTPFTDELTLGFERELAPEWSASLTYIRRKAYDLLQDSDLNHITCDQYGDVIGIDPRIICGSAGNFLETDQFGSVAFNPAGGNVEGGNLSYNIAYSLPNGVPDLYVINNGFNQVLRIANLNSSDYEAYEVKVVKRLHRNWQMQASYTLSEAFGQAEDFDSTVGDDPQTTGAEDGYLNFDQRHILKFQAVTKLPHEVSLGTAIQWASGTPYSVRNTVVDLDRTGNVIFRSFFPTNQRNDQRNEGFWKIDLKLDKNFTIGRVQASGFIGVENILNTDYLTINEFDITSLDGIPLDATYDFGRRFEVGAIFNF